MMNLFGMLAMAPADGEPQSGAFMFVWLALMGLMFYFLLIRPNRRREKERQALLASVKSGDRVLLSGGILGTVANVKEKTLVIKIADGVKVEAVRAAISQILSKSDLPSEESK